MSTSTHTRPVARRTPNPDKTRTRHLATPSPAMDPESMRSHVGEATQLLRALANDKRLMLLCLQISCGFAVMRGRNWGRWGYVVCQCIVVLYLLLATIGSVFPEVFTVEGETSGQILHVLILQKIPDVVILALLFVPTASRRFFAARK